MTFVVTSDVHSAMTSKWTALVIHALYNHIYPYTNQHRRWMTVIINAAKFDEVALTS